ncbi:DUF998 domain-containing protein [Cellulomonas sp. URHD0024]|uniref:DUF998 domain-containing protein n=1 Tax=Cellulomonas sp. URHD0024 TaxID=1302620 RepID=UPI0004034EE6|nr:DUF998 domain-containing protein [Cellulomonas sp. URHD0024]
MTDDQDATAGGRLHVVPLLIGAAAALLYSNFLLDWVLRGFAGMGDLVSALEAPGERNATLLRVTDVVCAVLVVCLLPRVRRRLPSGGWREVFVVATVVFALGAALAAVVASPCGPGAVCEGGARATLVHDTSSIVSDTALFVGAGAVWLATRRTGPVWFRRAAALVVVVGGIVASLVFGWFTRTGDPAWAVGVSQRVHIVCMSAWLASLGLFAALPRPPGLAPGPRSEGQENATIPRQERT